MLNRYQDAATSAAHTAQLAGRTLDKDAMRAEIEQRYACLAQAANSEVSEEVRPPPLQRACLQQAADYELRLTGINPEFYELFRNYALGAAARSPRTFNGYLKQLRQLLPWCEEQEVLVSPRFCGCCAWGPATWA